MTKSQTTKKAFVIPLKKGIPLVGATTNTSQHFLFSTAVASYCWDSVYFFQKLRNDGVVQFENLKMHQFENVFSSTKKLSTLRTLQTFNSKKLKTKSQQLKASKKKTFNFINFQLSTFNFQLKKSSVIPLKKGIPLVGATTNTNQHFLFSTAVASHCWDSVYFFQKLRNDGLGQFENNFFAEKRTSNFELRTFNFINFTNFKLNKN